MDEIDIEYHEMIANEPAEPESIETRSECLWCDRARDILFGGTAILIGLVFLAVGIDLATDGALSGRWVRIEEVSDDDDTS